MIKITHTIPDKNGKTSRVYFFHPPIAPPVSCEVYEVVLSWSALLQARPCKLGNRAFYTSLSTSLPPLAACARQLYSLQSWSSSFGRLAFRCLPDAPHQTAAEPQRYYLQRTLLNMYVDVQQPAAAPQFIQKQIYTFYGDGSSQWQQQSRRCLSPSFSSVFFFSLTRMSCRRICHVIFLALMLSET